MKDDRKIEMDDVIQLAAKYNISFNELSCITDYENLNGIFKNIIESIYIDVNKREERNTNNNNVFLIRYQEKKCLRCC